MKVSFLSIICIIFSSSNLYSQQSLDLSNDQYLESYYDSLSSLVRYSITAPKDYLEVAEYELNKGDVYGRKAAAHILKLGLRIYPENLDLKSKLGIISYKQGFSFRSRDIFEEIVEEDPDRGEAWFYLGDIYRAKCERYKNLMSSYGFTFTDYSIEYYDKARGALNKCINLDYQTNAAISYLFWLEFDFGNYNLAANVISDYLDNNDGTWEVFLLGELANVKLKNYEIADAYLGLYYNCDIPDDIYLAYEESVSLVTKGNKSFQSTYEFASRDPLIITPYNERELEHFARVTYSQEKFTIPSLGVVGWSSDRGRTLIKYGSPGEVTLFRSEIAGGTRIPGFLIWGYPGFRFEFTDIFGNGNFIYADFSDIRATQSTTQLADVTDRKYHEGYQLEMKGGEAFAGNEFICNYRNKNFTQSNFNFYVHPVNRIWDLDEWEFLLMRAPQGSFEHIIIKEWKASDKEFKLWIREGSIYGQYGFLNKPGNYSWIFEGYNKSTQEFFRKEFTDSLLFFNKDRFTIGEIQLGYQSYKKIAGLKDIQEIPNASHSFRKNDNIVVSFNVNNLDKNTTGNDLVIEYKIQPKAEDKTLWEKLGSFFLGDEKSDLGVSVTNTVTLEDERQPIKQVLDISSLEPHLYELEIQIKEEFMDKSESRKVVFLIK